MTEILNNYGSNQAYGIRNFPKNTTKFCINFQGHITKIINNFGSKRARGIGNFPKKWKNLWINFQSQI